MSDTRSVIRGILTESQLTETELIVESLGRNAKLWILFENITTEKVLKEEDRGTYIYRKEIWSLSGNDPTIMHSAYSKVDGSYVGESKMADTMKKKGNNAQTGCCRSHTN